MISQHPPPGADSALDHPGEPGRLVLYRDGLIAWEICRRRDDPTLRTVLSRDLSRRLRLEVERHSLWHSRMSAASGTGAVVILHGRSWYYDMRGRFAVERLHEGGRGARIGVELSAVDPVRWYVV